VKDRSHHRKTVNIGCVSELTECVLIDTPKGDDGEWCARGNREESSLPERWRFPRDDTVRTQERVIRAFVSPDDARSVMAGDADGATRKKAAGIGDAHTGFREMQSIGADGDRKVDASVDKQRCAARLSDVAEVFPEIEERAVVCPMTQVNGDGFGERGLECALEAAKEAPRRARVTDEVNTRDSLHVLNPSRIR